MKFEAIYQSNNQVETKLGLEIIILDINDHAPTFQNPVNEVTVDESHDQGNPYTSLLQYFTIPFMKQNTQNR